MFNRSVVLVCVVTASGGLSAACDITNCEEGAICLDEHRDSVTYECAALCQHLVDCGRVARDLRGECIDACLEGFERDEDAMEDYCECSAESSCRELTRECGRPPFTLPPGEQEEEPEQDAGRPRPDAGAQPQTDAGTRPDAGSADAASSVDASESADASGSADASDSADSGPSSDADSPDATTPPDAATGSCSHDEHCAASEGCLNGACHARCQASCECRLGDVCESGLCVTPPPASMSCESDCDCPAGDQCLASVCSPGAAPLQ
jgi:hypothetical protein